MESTFTLRKPPSTYLRVRVIQAQKATPVILDEITVKTHLDAALNQYLGLTGLAVPIDILKVEGQSAWIRVSIEDESPVVAALAQWTGKGGITLRTQGRSAWLGALVNDEDDEKLWSLERLADLTTLHESVELNKSVGYPRSPQEFPVPMGGRIPTIKPKHAH